MLACRGREGRLPAAGACQGLRGVLELDGRVDPVVRSGRRYATAGFDSGAGRAPLKTSQRIIDTSPAA